MARPYPNDPVVGSPIHHMTFVRGERDEQDGRRYWVCRCVCGEEVRRRPSTFINGWKKSCGCKRGGANHGLWRGCGSLSGYYFACLKMSAKNRRIPFCITIQQAWYTFDRQKGLCALTGLPLMFATVSQSQAGRPGTASLDRIDSSKPYIEDNIQWVHKDVNLMKNELSQERFVEVCKLVAAQAEARAA